MIDINEFINNTTKRLNEEKTGSAGTVTMIVLLTIVGVGMVGVCALWCYCHHRNDKRLSSKPANEMTNILDAEEANPNRFRVMTMGDFQ